MAREQVGYDPRPEALATTVSPNFQMVQPQSAEVIQSGNNAYRLAEVLGSGTLQLQKWNEEQDKLKTESQQRKLPYYADLFKQDMPEGGAVTQAQVRARFPETVPVIAARVAEIMGGDEAQKHAAAINEHILSDDSLKLDTVARTAYIDQQRQEHMSQYAGKENDFFSSGYITAFDNGMNQYQGQYAQATAQFHQKVQADDFSKKIEQLFLGNKEGLAVGLDAAWGSSSSLNNLERNKIVVDTVTKTAFATFDPEMMDRIPNRFLNAEAIKDIQGVKQQITQARYAEFNHQQSVNTAAEKEYVKKGKNEILDSVTKGNSFNPNAYAGNPELFDFAVKMRETPPVSAAESASNKALLVNRMMTDATFNYSSGQENLNKEILNNMKINPNDKVALLAEVPKLMEGYQALRDPVVTDVLNARINPRLAPLEQSPTAEITRLLAGRSLRTEVTTSFRAGLNADFQAFYAEHGSFPIGKAKMEMVEKQVAKAELDLTEKAKIENMQHYIYEHTSPAVPAKPAPAVVTPKPAATAKPAVSKSPKASTGKTQVLNIDGTPLLINGEAVYKYK